MNTRAALATAALVASGLVPLTLSSPAAGAGETCQGQAATLVGTPHGSVTGTDGPDVIVTNGARHVSALGGDDRICTTGTIASAATDVVVWAGVGDDVVDRSGDGVSTDAAVALGDGADVFVGSAGSDVVWMAGTGPDVVGTGAGADTVFADRHNWDDASTVDLGAGDDFVESMEGVPFGDFLGAEWSVTASAGDGGALRLDGGPGADRRRLRADETGTWRDDVATGTLRTPGRSLAFAGFESYHYLSGPGRVRFTGSRDGELLVVGAAVLRSAHLKGGADRVELSDANGLRARLVGGRGRDTVAVTEFHRNTSIRVDLRAGRLSSGRSGRAELRGVEDVSATARFVRLAGDGGANVLRAGGCGAAAVSGRGGDDRIVHANLDCAPAHVPMRAHGGSGHDRLVGGRGPDRLDGGPGRDVANGKGGVDLCVAVEVRRSCERP